MDSERKQQILAAERRFREARRMSDALAERGFYVMGPARVQQSATVPPEFAAPVQPEAFDDRVGR